MDDKDLFQQDMQPWIELQPFGRRIKLRDKNLELFYFEAGDEEKTNLVMIHGLGDEADTWRHVFLPLAEDYHVLALDLPGFGRSDEPNQKYTPKFLMGSIMQMIHQLQINNAVLIGSSLGAILSHALALKYPDCFSGLILVGGGLLQLEPRCDWSTRLMQMPLIGEWLYTRLRKSPDAAFDSLRNVYHNLDLLPEEDQAFLSLRVNQRVWSDGQRRAYFSTLRHLTPWVKTLQSSLPDQLSQFLAPTLIIRGEYDNLFPKENAIGVSKVQPNASMTTIENVGHLPHQEAPSKFLQAVQLWLVSEMNHPA